MKLNDIVLIKTDDGVIDGKIIGLSDPLPSDWCLCYEIKTNNGTFSVMEEDCIELKWWDELINL